MKTIVPAKRQINPWKVARWTGLAVIVSVLGYFLIVWPWVIILTPDPRTSEDDLWPGLPAAMLILVQVFVAVVAFFVWLMNGGPQDVWKWLKEREADYDRKHTPDDDR